MRALLALCLATSTAAADPGPDDDSPFAFVGAHLGLGTPVGSLGVEAGVGLSWLRLSAGTGLGFLGVQKAVAARLAFPGDSGRFFLGAGLSKGPGVNELGISLGEDSSEPPGRVDHGKRTIWTNLELGVEWTARRVVEIRLYGGITMPTRTDCAFVLDGMTTPCDAEQQQRLGGTAPYFGFSMARRIH